MISLVLSVLALLLAIGVLVGLVAGSWLAAAVVLLAIAVVLDHSGFVVRGRA